MAQLADAARTLSRAGRDDRDVARAFAAELVAHVLGDAGRVRGTEKIAAVENDYLAADARRELRQIAAVHDVVLVFLRIHDPRHSVDAGKQGINALSVLEGNRVEVG